MNTEYYAHEAMRTYNLAHRPQAQLIIAALGLAGESGEVADHVKKMLAQGHDLDTQHVAKELGDILWYVVLACDAINVPLGNVMQMNIDKLRKRYPDGFDAERSRNRED